LTSDSSNEFEPITVKEAVALLASLHSSTVLPALRHPDFVMLGGLAFQGFRMDAGGYANPIVRRRLAEEAAKNHKFAAKLRELSKQPKPQPPNTAVIPKPPLANPLVQNTRGDEEKYRLERDRLKIERDTALQLKQAGERQLTDSKRQLLAATTEKVELAKENERLKQRIERLDRKQRQLETTNAALRRAAIMAPVPQTPTPQPPEAAMHADPGADQRPFAEAVRHLLTKNREAVALSIANDVLRASADNVDALEIKAEALIKTDKPRDAVSALRSLITLHIKHGSIVNAAAGLYKLMLIGHNPGTESRSVREFMSALVRSGTDPGKLSEPLTALRSDNPAAFAFVKSLTPASILHLTFPEDTTFAPDIPFPFVLASAAGLTITARRLVAAIDRSDCTIVELVQDALNKLNSEDRDKILASVTRAADGDSVYLKVLLPKYARGAVIVDTSNVAWHGQEMLAQQQPRIEYVLAIRRILWEKGFFPVLLIADANLPFVINDGAALRRMADEEQIQLVIGGSDADEQILREAMRMHAPIVSNDYMADWDPEQKVIKIQYSFTADGKPSVYL
jgi:hypothetical protein